MTRKIGKITLLEATPPERCQICGKIDELRPYDPNQENICFECGMKDEETTEAQFWKFVNNSSTQH